MNGIYLLRAALILCFTVTNANIIDCPATGIVFIPHPTSCSDFIQCVNGDYQIFACGSGLHFNPVVGFCQLPDVVGCTIEDEIEIDSNEEDNDVLPEDDTSVDDGNSDDGYDDEDNEISSSEIPPIDDGSGDDSNSDDDYGDADNEISSSENDGNPPSSVEDGSPPNDESNEEGDKIVPEDDENIDDSDDIPSSIEEDEFPPSVEDDEIESGEIESDNDNVSVNCPETGQYFLPHPSSCSRFIKCNNGVFRVIQCFGDLHFDPILGWCDDPSVVNCVLPEEDDSSDNVICPATGIYFLPHPRRCAQFVKCNNGEYREIDCVDGLHFDPIKGWCDDPEIVNCTIDETTTEGSMVECPDQYQHFFPHPSKCSKFLECNRGIYRVIDCIPGLHFNRETGHCDFPSYANCDLEDEPENESKENLVDCPATGQHFYAHPSICSKFIECNRGDYRVLDCISGLYFDSAKGFCDFPTSSDCSS